jgi:hypothetical protein
MQKFYGISLKKAGFTYEPLLASIDEHLYTCYTENRKTRGENGGAIVVVSAISAERWGRTQR